VENASNALARQSREKRAPWENGAGKTESLWHPARMSLAEIRAQVRTMSRSDRLSLAEYLDALNQLDDPAVSTEVNAAMQRMDAGRKISEAEVLAAHERLVAEGR
jgi:hypothetical protein